MTNKLILAALTLVLVGCQHKYTTPAPIPAACAPVSTDPERHIRTWMDWKHPSLVLPHYEARNVSAPEQVTLPEYGCVTRFRAEIRNVMVTETWETRDFWLDGPTLVRFSEPLP